MDCADDYGGTYAGAGTSCSDVTDVATCALGASTPTCPTDGNWVDCYGGKVRGDPSTSCDDACNGQCCAGSFACAKTTACIKKDVENPSCIGRYACYRAGYKGGFNLQIDESCIGDVACTYMFYKNANSGMVSLTNSCLCDYACSLRSPIRRRRLRRLLPVDNTAHCLGSFPTPLDGLPSPCGTSFNGIIGQTGFDTCMVSFSFGLLQLFACCCVFVLDRPSPTRFSKHGVIICIRASKGGR